MALSVVLAPNPPPPSRRGGHHCLPRAEAEEENRFVIPAGPDFSAVGDVVVVYGTKVCPRRDDEAVFFLRFGVLGVEEGNDCLLCGRGVRGLGARTTDSAMPTPRKQECVPPKPLYLRAIEIEKALGPEHPGLARTPTSKTWVFRT